ncbi:MULTISPECIES: ABC transporter permease [Helcococcus]|uniref:ABC transporter permease n=1 Tax=Helcococcus bovis TaxID=3153252 RepID=A0ABW9F8G2_9FIRM
MKENKLNKLFTNQLFTTLLAIFLGLILGAVLLLITKINPIEAYKQMIVGVFGSQRNIAEVVIKATPIILTGASVAFAFKTGLFNIGAEGQYMFGFTLAGIVGILLNLPWFIQIPLLLLVGMLAGIIFGGLSGFLKAKFGVHEVISGIMMNWIALHFHNYVALSSPLFIQETSGTDAINISGQIKLFAAQKAAGDYQSIVNVPVIGKILGRSDINYGIIIAVIAAIVLHYIIKKSTLGYQLRAVGFNKHAAEFAGINVNKNIIRAMAISGAIAGLAGAVNIMALSPHKITSLAAFENYGFDGLSVALIAGSNILGTILAAILYSVLKIGGNIIQLQYNAPTEIISILIGGIIFFIALANILPYLADKIASRKLKKKDNKSNS